MLSREDGQELITSFNQGMRDLADAFRAFGETLSITFSFAERTTGLFYHIAGKVLFPMQDLYQDTGADDPPSFSKLHAELRREGVGVYIGTVITSIIPAIIGVIFSITLVPLVFNSAQSLVKGFVQIFNLPLLDLEKRKISYITLWHIDTGNDKRNLARHIYGLPGYILGSVCALPFSLVTTLFRGIVNNGETFIRTIIWGANLSLAKGYKIEAITDIKEDPRNPIKKYGVGIVGLILGAGVSFVATIAISSYLTAVQIFTSQINLVLPAKSQIAAIYGITEDKRNKLAKFGGGLAGLIIGGIAGFVSALSIAAIRFTWQVFKDSILSIGLMTVRTLSLALENNIDYIDSRTNGHKFGFGLIGALLGSLVGGIAALATSTFLTAIQTFTSLTNLSLPDKFKIESIHGLTGDKRYKIAKFGLGLVGFLIGCATGSIVSLIFGSGRTLWYLARHTAYSFCALGGSLGNGAFYRPWFAGLGGDQRKTHQKVAGALGYLAATLTIAPLAFTYFSAIRLGMLSLFIIGAGPGGLACFILKGLARLGNNQFAKLKDINPTHLEKFKNLYSSIAFGGTFKEGKTLVTGGSGSENFYRFLGKCIRLNLNSSTEHLLNTVLSDYQKCSKNDREHFFDDINNLRPAITATQNRYQPSWINSSDAIQITHEHIEKVADFIFNYMKTNEAKIPKLYSSQKPVSWSATFWGESKTKTKTAATSMTPRLSV